MKQVKAEHKGKRISVTKMGGAVVVTNDIKEEQIAFYEMMGLGYIFEQAPKLDTKAMATKATSYKLKDILEKENNKKSKKTKKNDIAERE